MPNGHPSLWGALLAGVLLAACAIHPEPLNPKLVQQETRDDIERIFAAQDPVTNLITLSEAQARALKYNLEQRIKLMEEAVAIGQTDVVKMDLLPQLTASAGYNSRAPHAGSSSRSLTTGLDSNEVSISQERHRRMADVTLVWNILDFGVSYVQAHQQMDAMLVVREQRRRAIQNILQEVREAFWRAAVAQYLLPEMDRLLDATQEALERSRAMEKEKAQDPARALDYQRDLLETTQKLWGVRRELASAKNELAALMNLKPGTPFELAIGQDDRLSAPPHHLTVEDFENYALRHRPELMEQGYQQRISAWEVKKTLLRMLPGLEFSASGQMDSTRFLAHNSWSEAGLRLSWSLINLLAGPRNVSLARDKEDLARLRRLAMGMAIITQLNLAFQRTGLAQRELKIAEDLVQVHGRRAQHAEAQVQAATGTDMEAIKNRTELLFARLKRGLALAEMEGALGRIYHTLGVDPIPQTVPGHDTRVLAQAIEMHQRNLFGMMQEPYEVVVPLEDANMAPPAMAVESINMIPTMNGWTSVRPNSGMSRHDFWGSLEQIFKSSPANQQLSPVQTTPQPPAKAAPPQATAVPRAEPPEAPPDPYIVAPQSDPSPFRVYH